MDWVQQVLLPQIRKIDSRIRLHKVDRAELISTSRGKVTELYYLPKAITRQVTPPHYTSLIDDWVEGGVVYDAPTNINLTRYSVMMPVEDLKHLCGREARKHGHHFDAGYEYFIQNGPRDPIYLAIERTGEQK